MAKPDWWRKLTKPIELGPRRKLGTLHDVGRPATLGAMQNMPADPSGIGSANKVAPIPPPRITVPTVPQFK
jgi:hypothetical protein